MESTVGNTRLIELDFLYPYVKRHIYAKAEHLQLTNSVKARAALNMIESLEKSGSIKKGDHIIEATGGNTGVALAAICQAKGYKCHLCMVKTTVIEKVSKMRDVYGADVILCEAVPFTNTQQHYYWTAKRLSEENNWYFTNQFNNLDNGLAHYHHTAPEILKQLDTKPLHGFICAAGTGGSINGCSNYFKDTLKDQVTIGLIDCLGSGLYDYVQTNGKNTYTIDTIPNITFLTTSKGGSVSEGIGINRLTNNFKQAKIDVAFQCNDEETVKMFFYLLSTQSLFIGPSACLNVIGAIKLALTLPEDSNVCTILCDAGELYQSKMFNQTFREQRNITSYTQLTAEELDNPLTFLNID